MQLVKKQAGLTLIEMMIAMLLGLLVTGSIITIFISNVKSSSENIQMIQLNQELRVVMGFMSDELKRSGYSGTAEANHMNYFDRPDAQCVQYAYDHLNDDGVVDDEEKFGFRLNNNAIEWGVNVACGTNTNWQDLTDTDIIDNLTLTMIESSVATINPNIKVRQLDVVISGTKNLNPGTATRRFTEAMRIRNDVAN